MSNFFEEVLFANVFNLPNDLQAGHKYFNELFVITFTKQFSMFKTVSKQVLTFGFTENRSQSQQLKLQYIFLGLLPAN